MKWITIFVEDPLSETNLKITPMEVRGVKILMLNLLSILKLF